MKTAKPILLALACLPALAHAHAGPAGHGHAADFADSPAFGFVVGLAVAALLLAFRWLPRRARTTATKRR
jgi:hypothetical protein